MKRISQIAAIVVAVAGITNISNAQDLVGDPSMPIGINNLEITYSGGTALFNVRFDERSFNDAYGAAAPNVIFTSEPDVSAAMNEVSDFLNTFFPLNTLDTVHPVDTTLNRRLGYPFEWDATHVTRFNDASFSGPAGWNYNDFSGPYGVMFARDETFEDFGESEFAWPVFTPASTLSADLNIDCVVDSSDLGLLIGAFGTSQMVADINDDGVVNTSDLGLLIGQFGQLCESP